MIRMSISKIFSVIIQGIALMKMKRKPVNSLNLEFLQDIRNTIVTLEQNKKCKGLILTSVSNVFKILSKILICGNSSK